MSQTKVDASEQIEMSDKSNLSEKAFIPVELPSTTTDLMPLLLRRYEQVSPTVQSLIPYMIINDIASNFLESFISAAAFANEDCLDRDAEGLRTSCVNTAYSSSIIFFGEKKAKQAFSRLMVAKEPNYNIALPSGKRLEFKLKILGGDLIREMNKNHDLSVTEDDLVETQIINYLQPSLDSFAQSIQPLLDETLKESEGNDELFKEKLHSKLAKIDYNINAANLKALKEEISQNRGETTLDQSFVYYIGSVSIDETGYAFEHVFLIEQFFLHDEQSQEVRYRVYQSWVEEASLLDDFTKKGFGKNAENTWDQKQMDNFLVRFSAFVSPNNRLPYNILSKLCFGYPLNYERPVIAFNGTEFLGTSVRYYSSAINPSQSIQHLEEFLQSQPKLSEQFKALVESKNSSGGVVPVSHKNIPESSEEAESENQRVIKF